MKASPTGNRVRLTLAYDGAAFSGWQSQSGGGGVQDAIERAIARITQQPTRVHGAGRTDAGVHALAQVAHFDAPASIRLSPEEWGRALNANLANEVRVIRAARAPGDFHARFSARGKIYRYEIHHAPVLPPHRFRRAWHLPQPIDRAILREVAQAFEGRHDFRAFAANRGIPVTDTIRTIRSVRVSGSGPAICLTFEGDGFLYKMVRMIVGATIRAALGRESPARIRALLADPTSGKWTHVAPADGLYLVRVLY